MKSLAKVPNARVRFNRACLRTDNECGFLQLDGGVRYKRESATVKKEVTVKWPRETGAVVSRYQPLHKFHRESTHCSCVFLSVEYS